MASKAKLPLVILLFFLLFLCASISVAVAKYDPDELQRCMRECEKREAGEARLRCRHGCEDRYGGSNQSQQKGREQEEEEEHNPYIFEAEHFTTSVRTEEGGLTVLQNFAERSKLLRGIENYRIAILEANPRTFIVPAHFDAEAIFYVAQGRATIKLVKEDKLQSFNVERGDIIRANAGTPVYMINRDDNEKLRIIKLLESVAIPGSVQAFVGAGGENPESLYRAFSTELLEAALNTGRDKLDRLLGRQKKGIIIKASQEQIQAMSRSEEEGGRWPFAAETKDNSFNLLKKKPSHCNNHGRIHEADSKDYPPLRDLDIAVSYANITQGSMAGPFYNSRSTKIAVVVKGKGYLEMACPHISSRPREQQTGERGEGGSQQQQQQRPTTYQKIRARLSPRVVFVLPAGHPVAVVASQRRRQSNDETLQIVCFDVNHHGNVRYPLAGKGNVISKLEKEAKQLAFDTASAREVDEIFQSQDKELFFPGPEQWQQQEGGGGNYGYWRII